MIFEKLKCKRGNTGGAIYLKKKYLNSLENITKLFENHFVFFVPCQPFRKVRS
jgi:exonuclease V gamma subunit